MNNKYLLTLVPIFVAVILLSSSFVSAASQQKTPVFSSFDSDEIIRQVKAILESEDHMVMGIAKEIASNPLNVSNAFHSKLRFGGCRASAVNLAGSAEQPCPLVELLPKIGTTS